MAPSPDVFVLRQRCRINPAAGTPEAVPMQGTAQRLPRGAASGWGWWGAALCPQHPRALHLVTKNSSMKHRQSGTLSQGRRGHANGVEARCQPALLAYAAAWCPPCTHLPAGLCWGLVDSREPMCLASLARTRATP